MSRVGKLVTPKRAILRNISLNFCPGAKIGVLGLNGSGKSTLLRIMAGVDGDFEGEAIPMPNLRIGFLPPGAPLAPAEGGGGDRRGGGCGGEAPPRPTLRIGFLPQEPQLDQAKDVRGNVEEGLAALVAARKRLEEIYAAYSEPDADFEKLAEEQARLEALFARGGNGREAAGGPRPPRGPP